MFHQYVSQSPELERPDYREIAVERAYDRFLQMRVSDLLKWLHEEHERPVVEGLIESLAEWSVESRDLAEGI